MAAKVDAVSVPTYVNRQAPSIQPTKPTNFRMNIKEMHGTINNAEDWVLFFNSLFPKNVKNKKALKLRIPETILFSSSGVPNSWFHSTSQGILKQKAQNHINLRAIQSHFRELHKKEDPQEFISIARYGFQSRTLRQSEFHNLCGKMDENRALAEATQQQHGHEAHPFCIQQYIPPKGSIRYITSCTRAEHNTQCHTFTSQYQARYSSSKKTQNGPELGRGGADPLVTYKVQTTENDRAEKAKSESETEIQKIIFAQLQHDTVSIMNSINESSKNQQLTGLVCEYIQSAQNDKLYFTAVLGTVWQGQKSSWERLRDVDPESQLIHEFMESKRISDQNRRDETTTSPRRESYVHNIDRMGNSSNGYQEFGGGIHTTRPRFPSIVPNDRVMKDHVSGFVHDRRPNSSSYGTEPAPKLFRNGRFVRQLTSDQSDQVCHHHAPIHRSCRPGLVLELTKKLEHMSDFVAEHSEKSHAAESAAQRSEHISKQIQKENDRLKRDIQRDREEFKAQLSSLENQNEALSAQLKTINKEFDVKGCKIEELEEQKSILKETIEHERETTFGVLKTVHSKTDKLEKQVQDQQETIEQLRIERQKLIERNKVEFEEQGSIQRRISRLKEELALEKEMRERAMEEVKKITKERDNLIRLVPLAYIPQDKKTRPIKLEVDDLLSVEPNPAAEHEIIQFHLQKHIQRLKGIFRHYADSGDSRGPNKTAKEGKTMSQNEVWKFIRDCHIAEKQQGAQGAEIDIIFKKTNMGVAGGGGGGSGGSSGPSPSPSPGLSSGGGSTGSARLRSRNSVLARDQVLSFGEFCEFIVRISELKVTSEQHLGDRVLKFLEYTVFPFAQSKV